MRIWIQVLMLLLIADSARADSWSVMRPGLAGSDYKLVATLESVATAAWIADSRPAHANYYKASFWIDPTGIQMPEGTSSIRFMNIVDDSEGGMDAHPMGVIAVGYLANRSSDHAWHMTFWNLQDSGSYAKAVDLQLGPASEFPMRVEIEFWAGGVGTTTFCAREFSAVQAPQQCTSALDMEWADVDEVRVGLFANGNPNHHLGSYSFDELRSDW